MDYFLITAIISIIIFVSLTIIGISFASDDEDEEKEQTEDIVGEILETENISRNPPEINQTEEIDSTGQISSFTEGPVVVVPP